MPPTDKTPHRLLHGSPVSPGIGHGPAFLLTTRQQTVVRRSVSAELVDAEVARFDSAVERTREQIRNARRMVSDKVDRVHASIFEAQEALLDDPLLIDNCRREIRTQSVNAEFALHTIMAQIRQLFEQIDTPMVSVHNLDVLDVTARLHDSLVPEAERASPAIARESIIIAHTLHPSDTAELSRLDILGIVTETGGPTSHFAILAKAMGIPVVVGLKGILNLVANGDPVIADGFSGTVTIRPTRLDKEKLRRNLRRAKDEAESLQGLRELRCETTDGYAVTLGGNLELPSEVGAIRQAGAEGIGLFRSESFYIDRGELVLEEEQFEAYRQVLEQMAPHPVTCRTLDLGGDKLMAQPWSEGDLTHWEGLRGIRLCLANPGLFRGQLRAMLRASAFGNMKIMLPLITDITEVREARQVIDSVKAELDREGVDYDRDVEVGVMVETPAAALTSEVLAQEVDFFSLGTNDLIQYTMALDRVMESASGVYDPIHPSVLELIKRTIESGHRAGIPVGVCGEMAGDPGLAALLVGLGVDELSVSAPAVAPVKRLIRSVDLDQLRQLRHDVLSHPEPGQAAQILARFVRKSKQKVSST